MTPGVQFNAPPPDTLPSIAQSINAALATLPPDATGAIVGIATERGVNAAVVARFSHGWAVQSWIGKSWGTSKPEFGAQVMKTW